MKLPQFRLRTLLLFVAVVGTLLGWVMWQRRLANRQEDAMAWLKRNGDSAVKGESRPPKLYVDHYRICRDANCDPDWYLCDQLEPLLTPIFGFRYQGAERLRVICDEEFAFTDEQIAKLHDLVDLKTISFFAYTLTDRQLIALSKLRPIENLLLDGASNITDDGACAIASMPRLYELELSGGEITDETLYALIRCPNLREIEITYNDRISYEAAKALRNKPGVRRFDVTGCGQITIEQQRELALGP